MSGGGVAPVKQGIGIESAPVAAAAPAPRPAPASTTQAAPSAGVEMRGAAILIESLLREGVSTIFGYPGGAILHVYDELARARDRISHVLVRHEQGAVHAAEGYARSSGRVGVVMVTSGPGATNCVTGLTNALMDSTPIVCITGQVPTHLIGNDAFQEADVVGITRPCTKYNYLVKDVRDLARVVKEAFFLARTGRPRQRRRGGRAARAVGAPEPAGHSDPDGPRRLPERAPAVSRDAGHARHLRRQHGRD